MKHMINAALATAALAFGPAAGAANYIAISGADVDFYYDADLWGAGAASVSGNTISFAINQFKQQTSGGDYLDATVSVGVQGALGVIAVAHSGYLLNDNLGTSPNVFVYSHGDDAATNGGTGISFVTGYAAGSFSDGGFTSHSRYAEYVYWLQHSYSDTHNITNEYDQLHTYDDPQAKYGALGLDIYFSADATIHGHGSIGAFMYGASYSFDVSPVPEPAAWLSLSAGLAALALVNRRRRRQA